MMSMNYAALALVSPLYQNSTITLALATMNICIKKLMEMKDFPTSLLMGRYVALKFQYGVDENTSREAVLLNHAINVCENVYHFPFGFVSVLNKLQMSFESLHNGDARFIQGTNSFGYLNQVVTCCLVAHRQTRYRRNAISLLDPKKLSDTDKIVCFLSFLGLLQKDTINSQVLADLPILVGKCTTNFCITKINLLLRNWIDSGNRKLSLAAYLITIRLSLENRLFYRYFRQYTADYLISSGFTPEIQMITSFGIKELIIHDIERKELLSFVYLYLKRLKDVTYICPVSLSNLINSLKYIVLSEDVDARAIWKVFLQPIHDHDLYGKGLILSSICEFMGSLSLVNNESEKWKNSRLECLKFLWFQIVTAESDIVFQNAVGSFFTFDFEHLETSCLSEKHDSLSKVFSYIIERLSSWSQVDVAPAFVEGLKALINEDLRRNVRKAVTLKGNTGIVADLLKTIDGEGKNRDQGWKNFVCASLGDYGTNSNFRKVYEDFRDLSVRAVVSASFMEFFIRYAYSPWIWRMFFKRESLLDYANLVREIDPIHGLSTSIEILIGYNLHMSLDKDDHTFWDILIDSFESRYDDLSDASSKYSNDETISIIGLCLSFAIWFDFSRKSSTRLSQRLLELFELARSLNRVLALQFLSICISNISKLFESTERNQFNSKCAKIFASSNCPEHERHAAAFGLAYLINDEKDIPRSFLENDTSWVILAKILVTERGFNASPKLSGVGDGADAKVSTKFPYFDEVFNGKGKAQDISSPFEVFQFVDINLFQDWLCPKDSNFCVEKIEDSVLEKLKTFFVSGSARLSRISSQAVGILILMVFEKGSSNKTSSQPIIKTMFDLMSDRNSPSHILEVILSLAVDVSEVDELIIDPSRFYMDLVRMRTDAGNIAKLVMRLAISRLHVTDEKKNFEKQYSSLLMTSLMNGSAIDEEVLDHFQEITAVLVAESSMHLLEKIIMETFTNHPDRLIYIKVRKVDLAKASEYFSALTMGKENPITWANASAYLLEKVFRDQQDCWLDKLLVNWEILVFLLDCNGNVFSQNSLDVLRSGLLSYYRDDSCDQSNDPYLGVAMSYVIDRIPFSKALQESKPKTFLGFMLAKICPTFAISFPFNELGMEECQQVCNSLQSLLQ